MSGERCWGGENFKMHDVQTKVKGQIMCIVKDLELVLGELKTVSTEMKEQSNGLLNLPVEASISEYGLTGMSDQERCVVTRTHRDIQIQGQFHPGCYQVVGQIDQLTSNLNLCEDINESYKSDTLDSSSSGVTVSTLEKSKDEPKLVIKAIPTSSAVLTVLRKSKPPPPPPRRTPVRLASPAKSTCTNNNHKTNGTNVHNGTHSTTDGLEGNCEECSARSDTSMQVSQSQLEADDETKSLSNTFFSQQSSKCVCYPSSTTKLEVPIQRKACTVNTCGCSARLQHNTCPQQRAPTICNSSTSTTNVTTASHSKHQSTVRKPTSTAV